MKRIICVLVCLIMVVTTALTAYSEDLEGMLYTYIDMVNAKLTITGSSAEVESYIIPVGNLKTTLIVRLQRKSGSGTWISIAVWTASNDTGSSGVVKTKKVTSGYSYRVFSTGKAYDSSGNVIETVNKYSPVRQY